MVEATIHWTGYFAPVGIAALVGVEAKAVAVWEHVVFEALSVTVCWTH